MNARNVEALAALIDQLYAATYGDTPGVTGAPSTQSMKHARWLAARGVAVLTDEEKAARRVKGETWE